MFNFLKRFFKLEKNGVTLNGSDDWTPLTRQKTLSGIAVNEMTALGHSAYWRGVNLISSRIARTPLHLHKRVGDGKERATRHEAYRLLKRQPNPEMSKYVWLQTSMSQVLTVGNSYSYIFRDVIGRPDELQLLDPNHTFPYRENGKLYYHTSVDGKPHKLDYWDVLHFKGLSFDGMCGLSVIDILKNELGLGLALTQYQSVYFRNNAKPSVIIELPAHLQKPEDVERFRRTFGEVHTGIENAHKIALLENGAKAITFGGDNEAAQVADLVANNLITFSNILGLPANYLNASITTSYSSLEQQSKSFLSDSLDGWLHMIESECSQKLLKEKEKENDSHFVEFDRKALEQTDLTTQTTALIAQLNNGIVSLNEVRSILNMSAIDDEQANKFRMPLNIGFVGDEEPEPQPEEPIEDEPEPTEEEPQEQQRSDNRLRELLKHNLLRLLNRIEKASQSDLKIEKHLQVASEEVAMLSDGAAKRIESYLFDLDYEIKSVTKEQLPLVFNRHRETIDTLIDLLLEGKNEL